MTLRGFRRATLARDTRGSESVEFAVVGWMLCMVVFAIVESGLLWWLKSGLEVTAAMTARCGAVGYTYNVPGASCPKGNTGATQTYALTVSNMFLVPNMVTLTNVAVNGAAGLVTGGTDPCLGMTGNFFSVTVTSNAFNFGIPPLNNKTLSASSCYPMP